MKGTLYGIGVGPGDPELLTLRAVRAIKECGCIAMPDLGPERRTAFDIAKDYLTDKPLLPLELPMIRDPEELLLKRGQAADRICEKLDSGESVGFLTLGDPTVYATYTYLHKLVTDRGYVAKIIPGITSFCAAAAALGQPLCEGEEPLHIIPALYGNVENALSLPGTKVLMKSGSKLGEALALIKKNNLAVSVAERVGLPGERLFHGLGAGTEEAADAGYFCVVIVKDAAHE
jgi:precorrin-2/cobalt-factor-2 C20-methyltransferase